MSRRWFSNARRWTSWFTVAPTVAEVVAEVAERQSLVVHNRWLCDEVRRHLLAFEFAAAAVLLEVARSDRADTVDVSWPMAA